LLSANLAKAADLLEVQNAALREEQEAHTQARSIIARQPAAVAELRNELMSIRAAVEAEIADARQWQASAVAQAQTAVISLAREAGQQRSERERAESVCEQLRAEVVQLRRRVDEAGSLERDAKDREREVSSLSDAVKRLRSAATDKDAAERTLQDVLEAFLTNSPEIPATIRATLAAPSHARQESAATFVGQHLQQVHSKMQRLAAENAQMVARAMKAESEIAGVAADLQRAQRQVEALQRDREERIREMSVLRVREQETAAKLQRIQAVFQKMAQKD
jgi:chromosome segregation ATPase